MLRDIQVGRTGTTLHRLAVVEASSMLRARHINVDALTQQQLSAVLRGRWGLALTRGLLVEAQV